MENKILSQLRLLKIYAAAMTVAFAVLCLTALTPSTQKQKFEEIDAERINIVDAHGSRQLVISNKDRFPEPLSNGRELKGMRSIRPAGLVFYDTRGKNEAGGLATFQTESGKNSLIAFDYATAEAIGFSRFESDDGKNYSAGFEVLDRPPPGTTIEEAGAKHRMRIAIQNENKDAQITLADADGKERIKLPAFRFSTATAGSFLLHRNERGHTTSSNQPMKPTGPDRVNASDLATTPCRGLSLSR